MGFAEAVPSVRPSDTRDSGPAIAMASASDPLPASLPDPRVLLERCWQEECDIDPMILRMRLLSLQGALPQADCLEQELLPLF